MTSFIITHVYPDTHEWNNNYGVYTNYTVDLQTDGLVTKGAQWNRKHAADGTHQAPELGATVEGDLEDTAKGWKFKLTGSPQSSGGGGSPPSGGGRGQSFKADPAKQQMIAMQAANNTALALLGHTATLKDKDLLSMSPAEKVALLTLVDRLADHFFDRAVAASGPSPAPAPVVAPVAPAPVAPTPDPDFEDDIPF